MRPPNGPTAKVREFASSQPGSLISWSEAQAAYSYGVVKGSYGGTRQAAAHHKMSVSNVLRRHFTRVEGARGLYVLTSSMTNHDREEDAEELEAFHAIHGCDEFGMSVSPIEAARQRRAKRALAKLFRMSDVGEVGELITEETA